MTWVHVFEEDSAGREVYRPESGAIPLSRRPRERVQMHEDGTASIFMPGPDDRFVECDATWTKEKGETVIRMADGTLELRVVERTATRLVIERRRGTDKG